MKKNLFFVSFALLTSLTLSACFSNSSNDELEGSIARLGDPAEEQTINESEVYEAGEARYEPYTPERLEQLKGNQKFVLSFHADWCPVCKNLKEKLLADLESMGSMQLLEADYDTDLELRREYDVTFQTTFLFFNESGEVDHKKINPSLNFIMDFFN